MFSIRKKSEKTVNTETKNIETHDERIRKTKSFIEAHREKKSAMPKGYLTKEEIQEEINKQFLKNKESDTNPFKTREDVYYTFYNSNGSISRHMVGFEEITIGGKKYYIRKKFEHGRIVIEEMYSNPDLEINLEEEYKKRKTTQAQIEKLNKQILLIKKKIAEGNEAYALIDIEDLKHEKIKLEMRLESIKYGKNAVWTIEDQVTRKKTYMLEYVNGNYRYLKKTENGYIVPENNIKFLKGYEIQKRLEEITNLRIQKNWKDIVIALIAIFIMVAFLFGCYKLITFEEDLFDERVNTFCADNIEFYKNSRDELQRDLRICQDPTQYVGQANTQSQPDFETPR